MKGVRIRRRKRKEDVAEGVRRRGGRRRKRGSKYRRRRRVEGVRGGGDAAVDRMRQIISMYVSKADQHSCQGQITNQSGGIEALFTVSANVHLHYEASLLQNKETKTD